jgi:hypothetical protein
LRYCGARSVIDRDCREGSGSRGLDPIAQAIRIVGDRALDSIQKISWVLVEPLARDTLASETEALEQGRPLAGVFMDIVRGDSLANRRLRGQAHDQGKQGKHTITLC